MLLGSDQTVYVRNCGNDGNKKHACSMKTEVQMTPQRLKSSKHAEFSGILVDGFLHFIRIRDEVSSIEITHTLS